MKTLPFITLGIPNLAHAFIRSSTIRMKVHQFFCEKIRVCVILIFFQILQANSCIFRPRKFTTFSEIHKCNFLKITQCYTVLSSKIHLDVCSSNLSDAVVAYAKPETVIINLSISEIDPPFSIDFVARRSELSKQ